MNTRTTLSTTAMVFIAGAITMGWTRQGAQRVELAPGVNVERVATTFSIASIGETSVFVPQDEGGTGQRQMVDTYVLYEHAPTGTAKIENYRVWGAMDDCVPFLQALMRREQARVDAELFGRPGYTPQFAFQQ